MIKIWLCLRPSRNWIQFNYEIHKNPVFTKPNVSWIRISLRSQNYNIKNRIIKGVIEKVASIDSEWHRET